MARYADVEVTQLQRLLAALHAGAATGKFARIHIFPLF
jgi:hypothetical protein